MDSKFLKSQEKLLLKQKEIVESDLVQVANKKKTGEKYEPKFIDLGQGNDDAAQEVTTYEEYIILEKSLSRVLSNVNRALAKIKKGRYGSCETCKKEINRERLKAVPIASQCLSCANKPRRGFRWTFWKR
ncbi:MAG: TraR/DksA C4-type zinc finger protein [Candidatus Berkelbacteria bacterium]|nr:TraR/DksA C4-type zinc finger protein [Candidatus Berkelbacteria bacterium]